MGREDHQLEDRLKAELPSILNWALDGLHRLTVINGNKFTRVKSVESLVSTMRDLASPVRAFVNECCERSPLFWIDVDQLYSEFKVWSENNGHNMTNKQVFGRDLRAAYTEIGMKRLRDGQARSRIYTGIRLASRS
jgi:putative DNA primase/helicase